MRASTSRRSRGPVRGVFSNESGLDSAAIAHAAAQTNSPVRQGIITMFGTFIDTLVACTMTALVILTSRAWTMTGADGGVPTGAVLTSNGFQASIAGGQYTVSKPSVGPWRFSDKDILDRRNGRRFLD